VAGCGWRWHLWLYELFQIGVKKKGLLASFLKKTKLIAHLLASFFFRNEANR